MATLSHAGGIVVRDDRGERRYLLVRAHKNPEQWVFPKGHIEEGETSEHAALREVCEEAGVVAEIRGLAGDLNFMSEGEQVSARYFAMLLVGQCASPPEREVLWCPFAEACALLSFDDARALLERVHSRREVAS